MVDPKLMTMIAQVFNFLILVFILAKFAYKPLMKILDERSAKIKSDLDSAEAENQAAQKLREEYLAKLNEARTEAQGIVDKAFKAAELSKQEIINEARSESERLVKAARDEIARERDKALNDLRAEVVTLSLAAASKIISKNMDEASNAKMVEDFINNLDDKKIGGLPC